MDLSTSITSCGLSGPELALLRKANTLTIEQLIMTPIEDFAKRCRISQIDVKRIFDKVIKRMPFPKIVCLDTSQHGDDVFTTGDDLLDSILGGGIKTGMVWEIVGESAAGKSQFALQLSLHVQRPLASKGLSGSTCYLTTSSSLPTARLLQIAEENFLTSAGCGLDDVHTLSAPTVALLEHILTVTLPAFIDQVASNPSRKRVRLLVIDALGELFHLSDKTTMSTLVERSKNIANISTSLHCLATKHRLAVVVLNEVIDVFHRQDLNDGTSPSDVLYEQQSKWFNTAAFFGEGRKEAALGLTWANQVNARIMLSRTGRRRYLTENEHPKRRQLAQLNSISQPIQQERQGEPTLIRRLSVLFSSVSQPAALDYIVSVSGISALPDSLTTLDSLAPQLASENTAKVAEVSVLPAYLEPPSEKVLPLTNNEAPSSQPNERDEFEDVWDQDSSYANFDWDALEEDLSQKKE
ncbi:P-loop containing nucleoside triphosphate hydrolase protein [Crepidotus variabilis]|uniref:P-loop containing nucleoside triphosphate hydrolase protein n=1 Tax=Crepidotus variabilis TaxID=179855 RepID=A0A9P6EQX9_9AGAR|nr:P-loop containing nucleoside triphosphate hydrolase protein [Crepidotus variabilis]